MRNSEGTLRQMENKKKKEKKEEINSKSCHQLERINGMSKNSKSMRVTFGTL